MANNLGSQQGENTPSTRYTPLSNLVYDVCTILSEKSAGLEVLDAYLQDAEEENDRELVNLFQQIIDADQDIIMRLQEQLPRLIRSGGNGGGQGSMRGQGGR